MISFQFKRSIRLITLFGLMVLVFSIGCFIVDPCGDGSNKYSVSESFDYSIDVDNQFRFRIDGINGSIEIVGKTDGSTVEVWGERIVKSDSRSDAQAHLDDLEIQISSSEDEIFVWTDQPRNTNGRNYEVEYHVRIPESWQVFAENTNGEIEIKIIANDVSVDLTNGDIRAVDIIGDLSAGLTNGNIDLTRIQGSVESYVTNGKIFGDVTVPLEGACDLKITNGNIDLEIPRSTSANFSARVTNGNIHIDDLTLSNLSTSKYSTTGVLGDGDGTVSLKVTNGNIHVVGF